MIKIGDICPLFFNPLKYEYANMGSYRQCFDTTDDIILQVFCDNGEVPTGTINDKINSTVTNIKFTKYNINDRVVMYYSSFRPSEGIYTVTVAGKESEEFEMCDNAKGILIEYTHKDNNSVFDNIFWNGDKQTAFKYRIPGGFKPSGVSIEVDNEQFVNQRQEIIELYAIPYTTRVFSIGDVNGVPYYAAELINKILCLSSVKIGGEYYVRESNSKPDVVEAIGRKELFMYSITLRPSENTIAGIGGKIEESVSASGASFALKNPNDGEVLVYSENENAFVNTNNLSSL